MLVFIIHGKSSCKNNRFKTSTWNEEFELPDG